MNGSWNPRRCAHVILERNAFQKNKDFKCVGTTNYMSCFQLQDTDLFRTKEWFWELREHTPAVPGATHIPQFPTWQNYVVIKTYPLFSFPCCMDLAPLSCRCTYFSTFISSFFPTSIVFSLWKRGRGIIKSIFYFAESKGLFWCKSPSDDNVKTETHYFRLFAKKTQTPSFI